MKLEEWMNIWINDFAYPNIKKRTYNCYKAILDNHIIPFIGNVEMEDVSHTLIQQFIILKLKKGNMITGEGLASNSINSIITVLKSAFACAVTSDIILKNPLSSVKRIKNNEKKIEAFTMKEQRIIEEAVASSKSINLYGIVICLYTGLRIGELLGLTWDDINFRSKTIRVSKTLYQAKNEEGRWVNYMDTPKTRNSLRIIPVSQKIMDILKLLKNSRTCEYVIETNGHATSVRTYQSKFGTLLKRSGVRVLGFHSLRHTFATRAIESGADIKTLSEIMGHKNAVITLNRYVHSRLDIKRKALDRLTKYTEKT